MHRLAGLIPLTRTTLPQSARDAGCALLVAWVDVPPPASGGAAAAGRPPSDRVRQEITAAVGGCGGCRVLLADPSTSAANRALAEALRVAGAPPVLQLYQDMKVRQAVGQCRVLHWYVAVLGGGAWRSGTLPPGGPAQASGLVERYTLHWRAGTLVLSGRQSVSPVQSASAPSKTFA